ncbi:MAG: T9SS type A sorting domain-containing protein [Bacteroidetes bacterium]|nr:T9SS type A sorting domain-containing protein [Bacteroidota bacterium]
MKCLRTISLLLLTTCVLLEAQVKIPKKISKLQEEANPYPLVSIRDIQFVPYDSLVEVEKVGANVSTNWLKQVSPRSVAKLGRRDTIEVVGQIIVPPKVITFTGIGGYNMVLRDTSAETASGAWSSVFVRTAQATDTFALFNAGLLTYKPGDIIRIRCYVDEFPSNNTVSYTQLVPVAANFRATSTMSQCVEYIDTKPLPPVPRLTAGEFMQGTYGSGKVKFTTGEQWECAYVELTDLVVVSHVNSTNGTFAMVDKYGNEISSMDGSKWFTLRVHKDPSSTYTLPALGQMIDTIRGYIASNSGTEAARGYRIFPVFPGDIVYGKVVMPNISSHRRTPVAVTTNDSVQISIKAYNVGDSTTAIRAVRLFYSINNAKFDSLLMIPNPMDSTYSVTLPKYPVGTFVRYFCRVETKVGLKAHYANAAGGTAWSDTSQGFFFYTVSNGNYTIHDVQYTPFKNGTSGLLGATVTVAGIVTADTSALNIGSNGITPWYIQSNNQPWNGIWIYGTIDTLYSLRIGDSILVTGTVQEFLQGTTGSVHRVTRLGNVSNVTIVARGKELPTPVVLTTGAFAGSNAFLTAEPYEGMVVRFENVTVTDTYPTYSDNTEYAINDGTGQILVRSADGKNSYSPILGDTLFNKTILKTGDRFSYIQGIVHYSWGFYKIVPRTNSDFGKYIPVTSVQQVAVHVPSEYFLSQNYPNPFNPTTRIDFALPKSGPVSLTIFNTLGQVVAKLVDGYYTAGTYTVQFDGKHLPSGLYFYRLQTEQQTLTKKMVLLK